MKDLLEAIKLREKGHVKKANQLLIELVHKYPDDAQVNYQCAWCYDVMGLEKEAVPYYEKAIDLGLPDSDLKEAYLGLGSTYRALGDYLKSEAILEKGVELYDDNAIKTFLSMTKYNLGKHNEAMALLLELLSSTSNDKDILKFKDAIHFYSVKLDQLW